MTVYSIVLVDRQQIVSGRMMEQQTRLAMKMYIAKDLLVHLWHSTKKAFSQSLLKLSKLGLP